MRARIPATLPLALGAIMALSGCASSGAGPDHPVASPAAPPEAGASLGGVPDPLFDDDYDALDELEVPDPAEESNRGIFRFNQQVDRFVFDPITRGYRLVVPGPVRTGVRNFFYNLDSPVIFANDLLQLEWEDAGVTLARLVVNSTLGLGGLFDVAGYMGLERHDSDFGQTLALAGAPSGPFVVVPLFGPTTVRDGFGTAVDLGMSPTVHLFGPVILLYYGGGSGLALREEHFDNLKALEKSSLDYYSALRSAWWQQRQSELWDRRQDRRVWATEDP